MASRPRGIGVSVNRVAVYDPRTADDVETWRAQLTWRGMTSNNASGVTSRAGWTTDGATVESDTLSGVFRQLAELVAATESTILKDVDG